MVTRRLVVASHNLHKIQEIKELTAHLDLQVVGLPEIGDFPPVLEDGETFQANAEKKAVEIANLTGDFVLADDSGLEVDALEGAPGVHSARFAGEPVSDKRNNELLLHKLAGLPLAKRGAQFRSVVALAGRRAEVKFSEGICRGVIIFEPKGHGGFGYDPLFLIPELGETFAQLKPEVKNSMSHRYLAMQGMLTALAELQLT
ncbi:MAG TPA: non-canonical purine NTP pyrophosphatase, RdgB/HAM1 family [Firmicutes bacterium]|nr:non-canonical purine NTP pyrophosphatase, RdgB/HAM1 family [Bacillota bacterium]